MSLGYKPRMIIDFLIVFTGTPAECGEQSKQRTLSPVSEQTQSYMWITACCQQVEGLEADITFGIFILLCVL